MAAIGSSIYPKTLELKWNADVDFSGSNEPQAFQSTLHRLLERAYQTLPWPPQLKTIAVSTYVKGGAGDIRAAAHAIRIIQNINPQAEFNWYMWNCPAEKYKPLTFLEGVDPSRVKLDPPQEPERVPVNLLFIGPFLCGETTGYLQSKLGIQLKGPRFAFLENRHAPFTMAITNAHCMAKGIPPEVLEEEYYTIHQQLFPSEFESADGLMMGLQEGTGIFLDEFRLKAPRKHGHCDLSYLLQLSDKDLQTDILSVMGESPDYALHSFNSGYVHQLRSFQKILFFAVHEKKKHFTMALNMKGEFHQFATPQEFCDAIFTKEWIALLKKCGYGNIQVKGPDGVTVDVQKSANPGERSLTIILRNSFNPSDMKYLQLASDRMATTGDNTPAESWAARCIAFTYEDVHNGNHSKIEFLQDQINLASTISPDLAQFLRLMGKIDPLTEEETAQAVHILQKDDAIEQGTLEFCRIVTERYSFQPVLEAALKRSAWHYCLGSEFLMKLEAHTFDMTFKKAMIGLLKDRKAKPQMISLEALPLLSSRLGMLVKMHLAASEEKES